MRIALPPVIDPAAFADLGVARELVTLRGETMGTSWSAMFACPPAIDPAAVRAAIVARLAGLVGEMSHWEADSLLSRFNRSAAGSWTSLPPDFAHVMAQGLRIAEASGGAFDPAIGRVVDLWGFGPVPTSGPPDSEQLNAARAASGWRRLAFDSDAHRLRQPGGLALDLSGIAKGHAVDAVSALLGSMGVRHHLVEIGGELVGRGVRPDAEPWWVDLEVPPAAGAAIEPLRVALHGLAVATSGDYRRGEHTLDPRTGRPCGNGVASVSVIAATALEADAWATALTVLGAEEGFAAAERADIAARWIHAAGSEIEERLSPRLVGLLSD